MRLTGYPSISGVTQGQQARFYEGRNPAGFCVPQDFLRGPVNSLKNGIFLHLKALSGPGQGDEAAERRYHVPFMKIRPLEQQ